VYISQELYRVLLIKGRSFAIFSNIILGNMYQASIGNLTLTLDAMIVPLAYNACIVTRCALYLCFMTSLTFVFCARGEAGGLGVGGAFLLRQPSVEIILKP
jgi:hypothetical protein